MGILDVTKAKEYLDLHIDEQFGCDRYRDTPTPEMGDVICHVVENNDDYAYGASKFVIIPSDANFVVKIPFNGWFEEDREENSGLKFYEFECCYDYCEKELNIYNSLAGSGFQHIFAETAFVGKTAEGRGIYIQEKIATTYSDGESSRKASEGSKDAVARMHSKYGRDYLSFEDDWLELAVECYGEEATSKMLAYVEENIWDMHRGNYGYRSDGTPVIIDYSDFNE